MSLVLDPSLALSWYFEDERSAEADAVLDRVVEEGAVVPALWRLEIANGLQMAIRRKRITAAFRDNALAELAAMAINVDGETDAHAWSATLRLADQFRLTVYDAAYLELARRRPGDRHRDPGGTMSSAIIIAPSSALSAPQLFTPTAKAAKRVLEFFTAQVNNDHTRKAYLNATRRFSEWCETHGLHELAAVQPFHVAAFVKEMQGKFAPPTVKQHLAALRMLFDWLVVGHIMETNPAHAVRGPKYVVKKGKTPVLTAEEARTLLDAIPTNGLTGLRDRALIGVMVYTFARVNAVIEMKVKDYFTQGRRGWVRLHEKGGKEHEVPCHHSLERILDDYIAAAGIAGDPNGPLFRSTGRRTGEIQALWQQDVYRMIQRRAPVAGITTKIGNHTFRATGITAYLKNKGLLEHAQTIANHASPRTTKLYDRRSDEISLDEIEKIAI